VRSNSVDAFPLLHVDDSADDRLLVREAILLTKTRFTVYEADSFEAAMPYFQFRKHDGEPKQYPRPALVLLDYNLGAHTGADFLIWLRVIKKITAIPVVMFSGRVGQQSIEKCYASGANHFLSKPNNLVSLKVIVRSLHVSFAILKRPGPIAQLQEYQPDPRDNANELKTTWPSSWTSTSRIDRYVVAALDKAATMEQLVQERRLW
jgi:CheY-like chemotaxis protein